MARSLDCEAQVLSISEGFDRAGCKASLHVVDLQTNEAIGVDPDVPVVLASVFKVLVALEFFAQTESGVLDPARPMLVEPRDHTAGGSGLSDFIDRAEVSLRDLCGLMLTISDNTATDILVDVVGLDRINERALHCGCSSTFIESDLQAVWDGIGRDMGFPDYATYAAAQAGRLGVDAQRHSTDPVRIDACAAYDPSRTNRSTARDMTGLLAAVWNNTGAAPEACARLRSVMSRQFSTRIGRGMPPGTSIAAKTGSLTGRINNEIGVVTHHDGKAYAIAVFTRAHRPFERTTSIEAEMAAGSAAAIAFHRRND